MEKTKAATKSQSAKVGQPASNKEDGLQSQPERIIAKARDSETDAIIKRSRKIVQENTRDLQHISNDIDVTKASMAASVGKLTDKSGGRSQSEKFMAKARELGLDEREEAFDAALTKVAKHRPTGSSPAADRAEDEL